MKVPKHLNPVLKAEQIPNQYSGSTSGGRSSSSSSRSSSSSSSTTILLLLLQLQSWQ